MPQVEQKKSSKQTSRIAYIYTDKNKMLNMNFYYETVLNKTKL